jgi:hypothetical protein
VTAAVFTALLMTAPAAAAVVVGAGYSVTPQAVAATQPFTIVLATRDWCPSDASATGSVSWGDGQTSDASFRPRADGRCDVVGSHLYAQAGAFTAATTFQDESVDTPVSVREWRFDAYPRKGFAGTAPEGWTLATFTYTGGSGPYTAVVDWGDGGTTTVPADQGYIRGDHAYNRAGSYRVEIALLRDGRPAGELTTRAVISDCSTPVGDGFVPPVAGVYERWIDLLYHDVLRRPPDATAAAAATAALANGATRSSIAFALLHGQEAHEVAAAERYAVLFGRARAPGETDSAPVLIAGREYSSLVLPSFIGSDNGRILLAAMCDLIGERPTDAELAAARSLPTLGDMVASLMSGDAYRRGLVGAFYTRYLRRPANLAELTVGVRRMQQESPEALPASLLASPEYFRRAGGGRVFAELPRVSRGHVRLRMLRRAVVKLALVRDGARAATRLLGSRVRGELAVDVARGALARGRYHLVAEAWSRGRLVDASEPVPVVLR